MLRLLPLLLVLATAACEAAPKTSPAADEIAKRFEPPPPAVGALYIFREGDYAKFWGVAIRLVGGTRTYLQDGTFLRVDMPPGLTELTCSTAGLIDRQRIDVVAGTVRYFEVVVRPGTTTPYCLVGEVSAEDAQPKIRAKRRVEPI